MRIVVTGASGLLGWHARTRLHAANCAARFHGAAEPYDVVALDHAAFDDDDRLRAAVAGAEAVLHFAGVSRAPDDEMEDANPAIAWRLVRAIRAVGGAPHVVYANSTHAGRDTAYGRSKRLAGEVLATALPRCTDLVLPHIFGEGARPFYNNVTAVLIHQILAGEAPGINPEGRVHLLHAGDAAQIAVDAACTGQVGRIEPEARPMTIAALHEGLAGIHDSDGRGLYPDLSDPFTLRLFNTYRAATYPGGWPRPLALNTDARGVLFEAVKGGGGGQTFLSTTRPGVTRGDHFHLHKVERFVVLQGEAVIRMRKVLTDREWEFRVSGSTPMAVDMPTLHTHAIENVGAGDLLTLFWAHEVFDPGAPDTYADTVLR
jgi:UDP-2-acetamido-2,6-beta-L-arabino-hexul-4-ose reductase